VRTALITLTALAALSLLVGCGSEIGDSCSINAECSPQGDRHCDTTSPAGYCTIFGCDFDTCPSEAVCVRFFSVMTNIPCDPATEDRGSDACTPDELCTLAGFCVPRAAELRACMRACSRDSDCRSGYECRDAEGMKLHGGEPVPEPGKVVEGELQPFCAVAPEP
jgi:hypothetical protein